MSSGLLTVIFSVFNNEINFFFVVFKEKGRVMLFLRRIAILFMGAGHRVNIFIIVLSAS